MPHVNYLSCELPEMLPRALQLVNERNENHPNGTHWTSHVSVTKTYQMVFSPVQTGFLR